MPRKKNNDLFNFSKIKYEEFFLENPIVLELILNNGEKYKGNCYNIQISSDKLFVLSKQGKIICKNIIPLSNIFSIKQYYLDVLEEEKYKDLDIQYKDEEYVEYNQNKGSYLLGLEGREKAKRQFQRNIKNKDKDFIKPEDEVIEEEEKLIIKGSELLEKPLKINNSEKND